MELSGEGQLGVRDKLCTRGWWAWNRQPRAVGTALSAGVQGAPGHCPGQATGCGFWVVLCEAGGWTL